MNSLAPYFFITCYNKSMYIQVKLLNGYQQSLWYKIPPRWHGAIAIGTIVQVPLRSQIISAVVIHDQKNSPQLAFAIKEIIEPEPFPADAHYTSFTRKLAAYYQIESMHFVKRIAHFLGEEAKNEEDVLSKQLLSAANAVQLTVEQQVVCDFLLPRISTPVYTPTVLHGVTGSGKTEIYKQLMLHAFGQGKTTVLLLPEVTLAISFEKRLRAELGDAITLCGFHSENYTSPAVLAAMGSVLTNKYAEGYPGKRYYAGCTVIDEVENLAIERCKKLFGAEHANVQPHAGSQANAAVYFASLKPGDTILGMSLAEGGHLTHGHKVNFSGTLYKGISYQVNKETELLDYDAIEQLAQHHMPKIIVAGASAYSRTIDFERFAAIAKQVDAYLVTDIAHIAGLVATGLHPSPVPHADFVTSTTHKTLRGPRGGLIMCKAEYAQEIDHAIMPGTQGGPFMHMIAAKAVAFEQALQPAFKQYQQTVLDNARALAHEFANLGYRIVAGGTDNHLFVVDLRNQKLNGNQAQIALQRAGINVSKSCIPFDEAKPWVTSGIRIGTPAISSRGMQPHQMPELAALIDDVIKNHENETLLRAIKAQVNILCEQFPLTR